MSLVAVRTDASLDMLLSRYQRMSSEHSTGKSKFLNVRSTAEIKTRFHV